MEGDAHSDYFSAYREARANNRMLLIDLGANFDFSTIAPEKLSGYVLCKVPADCTIEADGKQQRLLEAPAFQSLGKQPGLVIVDFRNEKTRRLAVSVLPKRHATKANVEIMLALPAGTLTQRTLLWAFRVHPERPAGVFGSADTTLMNHAANHSFEQAQYNVMYHAYWFPGNFEIVAESWSNQSIVDAAIDLVNLWRSSPAHWWAASAQWGKFGCDMKSNGQQWFGTGVFE
jgi:hypothetical protein